MRTCITLPTIALLLGASATTAFPAPASSSRAMPKNAPVNAAVAGGRGQDRRQLSSKENGAAFGVGLRGGAVESVAAASSSTSLSAGIGLVEACGLAAPIASIFVSLSPFPTVQKILRDKSVGDLPVLPYSSLVANWCVKLLRTLPVAVSTYMYMCLFVATLHTFSHFLHFCLPSKASYG